jgi:hypothetical protein
MPIMSVMAYGNRGFRRSTSAARALPGFVVIGGMRCGTSSFFDWISGHPDVRPSTSKEIHFFDVHYPRGVGWYRSHFPLRAQGGVSFEATPSYLTHPLAAERAAALIPEARMIALLREPGERAWSHYRFRRSQGFETRSFEEAVSAELAGEIPDTFASFRTARQIPYLLGGRYAEQLVRWIDAFGPEQVLIVDADRMFTDPDGVLERVEDYAGLARVPLELRRLNVSPAREADPAILEAVREHFRESNRKLRDLTDEPIGWLDSPR